MRAYSFFHHAVQFPFAAHGRTWLRRVFTELSRSDNLATPTARYLEHAGDSPGRDS